jgi:hypothetical protein
VRFFGFSARNRLIFPKTAKEKFGENLAAWLPGFDSMNIENKREVSLARDVAHAGTRRARRFQIRAANWRPRPSRV